MDHEFVTSRGKIILNDKRLLIQNLKVNFWKTALGEFTLPLLTLCCVVLFLFQPGKPFGYFATAILIALFFSTSLKQLYSVLIKRSYSDYIPLNRIKSFELKPDESGLETEIRLHLKNGRYRSIIFRTLEKQYEPLVELLSQYIVQPQFV